MNLVSREKAIDVAIDEYNRGYKEGFEAGKASVFAQPEIIHCKDCVHYSAYKDNYMCGVNMLVYVRENDFCSRAERRADE